jgi:hypothetical protein
MRYETMLKVSTLLEAALLTLVTLMLIAALVLAGMAIRDRMNSVPIAWSVRRDELRNWQHPDPVCERCGVILNAHSVDIECVPEQ